ncbi:thrombopoietin receptor [Betta splendens]|uniref:Thrombopoietin receptor n=1 Tax=Betta splendens TaxID=158456 RepID=A0A6P7MAJ1_BETSP|nr:thrombopoietin receptor [Betta splendens]
MASCRWGGVLITLWIQASFTPGILCTDGAVSHLSREDVLLINDQEHPKCFTRTAEDLTCFFEAADNRTYDLLYKIESLSSERRCAMSVQRTEEGTFLNICSFPEDDVFVFERIPLEVVERETNTILHRRNVSVEEHFFLDSPFNVSLHENDQAGQLRVSWLTNRTMFCQNQKFRIRYNSKSLGERSKTEGAVLESLVPGEPVQVQVSVRCSSGYWSRWSHPVQHMVPQSADDVSLMCFTDDLQNITCRWNGSRYGDGHGYGLFYKTSPSHTSNWTQWTECLATRGVTGVCHFVGDVSREVLVKISDHPAPLSKTFYTQRFTLNNSIKTPPPHHLRTRLEKGKVCVGWEAPLSSLLAHLGYELGYQTKGGEAWMIHREQASIPEGPTNETCVEVAAGTKYSVKVRAEPKGPTYSGHWSDWSEVLTGETPADIGMMLILWVPLLVVIAAISCWAMFSVYLSKIKQVIWPPVPNLDKVLQGFLAEINGQKWDVSVIAKQCPEETMSSIVEVLSQEDISELGKKPPESTQLLSPEGLFSSKEKLDWSSGTDNFPDYVTLNKDSTIICPKGNNYVYEQVAEKGGSHSVAADVLLQTRRCSCTVESCPCAQYLNHSYLPLADRFREPGNPYANLPCSYCKRTALHI